MHRSPCWGSTLFGIFGSGSEMGGTDFKSERTVSCCGFVRVLKRDLKRHLLILRSPGLSIILAANYCTVLPKGFAFHIYCYCKSSAKFFLSFHSVFIFCTISTNNRLVPCSSPSFTDATSVFELHLRLRPESRMRLVHYCIVLPLGLGFLS